MKKVFIISFVAIMFAFSCGEVHLKRNQEDDFRNYLSTVKDVNLSVTDYGDHFVAVYHKKDTVYSVYFSDEGSYIQASPTDYFQKIVYNDVSESEAEEFLQGLIRN